MSKVKEYGVPFILQRINKPETGWFNSTPRRFAIVKLYEEKIMLENDDDRFKVRDGTAYKPWENELAGLLRALAVLVKVVIMAVEFAAMSKEKQSVDKRKN